MTTLTPQNYESIMDRPSDTLWTAEDNARYAAGRAETVRLAQQRAEAKPIKTYYLATSDVVATFWIDNSKNEAELAFRCRRWSKAPNRPEIMTIEHARTRWIELIEAGFERW